MQSVCGAGLFSVRVLAVQSWAWPSCLKIKSNFKIVIEHWWLSRQSTLDTERLLSACVTSLTVLSLLRARNSRKNFFPLIETIIWSGLLIPLTQSPWLETFSCDVTRHGLGQNNAKCNCKPSAYMQSNCFSAQNLKTSSQSHSLVVF